MRATLMVSNEKEWDLVDQYLHCFHEPPLAEALLLYSMSYSQYFEKG